MTLEEELLEAKARIKELEEVCHNAVGAWDMLKALGAHKHLPGYKSCVDRLNDVLARQKD